jgi:hypothetical protein
MLHIAIERITEMLKNRFLPFIVASLAISAPPFAQTPTRVSRTTYGAASQVPSPLMPGRYYFATDTGQFWLGQSSGANLWINQPTTVTIGTVTTLAYGSAPTVTNTGTASALVLNFGIPAGATGATGATGSTGAVGTTGATGTSATISVGTVTALAAGATPTVANTGTTSAAVLSFGLPTVPPYRTGTVSAGSLVLAVAKTVPVVFSTPFTVAPTYISLTPYQASAVSLPLDYGVLQGSITTTGFSIVVTSVSLSLSTLQFMYEAK